MKTQYKVINRDNRKEYILNAKEVVEFFKHQHIRNYAVSKMPSKQETILEAFTFGFIAVTIVVFLTNLIVQWI